MLSGFRTIVARLAGGIISAGGIVAGSQRHRIGIQPIDTQELVGLTAAVGFPVETQQQLRNTVGHENVPVRIHPR